MIEKYGKKEFLKSLIMVMIPKRLVSLPSLTGGLRWMSNFQILGLSRPQVWQLGYVGKYGGAKRHKYRLTHTNLEWCLEELFWVPKCIPISPSNPHGVLKINVHAAIDQRSKIASLAAVAPGSDGLFSTGANALIFARSSLVPEALAIRLGSMLAKTFLK